jgi:DNA-binding GntR family transcriptional regulator
MTQAHAAADVGAGHGHGHGLRSSRKPRYLQIAETLRQEIRRGDYPVGQQLPSEAALCKRFGVSRYTARAALHLIEDLGLISRQRGAGTTVRRSETQVGFDQHIRSINDLLQYSQASGFQFLFTDRVHADSVLAGWLNVRIGVECIHLHGIRYHRRTQQPYCLGEVYRRASWQGLPQGFERMEDALRYMIEEKFQEHIGRVEQSLSAVALTEDEAHDLKVPVTTPGFRSLRHYFDIKGRLVIVAVTLHPGPMFSYHMRYERSDSGRI